jgi:protein-disulfide isomerase
MMVKFLRTLLLAALLPAAASAQAPSSPAPAFSQAQRDQIIAIVRDALKNDPSILRGAIVTLQAQDTAEEAAASKAAIVSRAKDLLGNPADPQAGNPRGDVTVVEFYDPRCPYCRRMLPGIDALLQKDHGIRLVYKDIPVLGPPSVLEARAILAAQKQGAYLKMQAALMSDAAPHEEAQLRKIAASLGLDSNRLAADMNSPETTARIKANLALAKDLKLQGTPAFVVGDQMIPGMVDASQLEAAVAGARKHA